MKRAYVVRIVLFLLVGILFWVTMLVRQLYTIQVVRHDELLVKTRKMIPPLVIKEPGRRGSILDRNGQLLASDNAYFRVELYKPNFRTYTDDVTDRVVKVSTEDLVHDLNLVFNIPKESLREKLVYKKPWQVTIAKDVEVSLIELIKKKELKSLPFYDLLKHPKLLSRLFFYITYKRFYPNDRLLSHVIGYQHFSDELGKDVGSIGVEKAWDEFLCPKKEGITSYMRGAKGNIIKFEEVSRTKPLHGSNVYLTIREQIQSIIETQLANMVKEFSPKTAYIMMANPKTGAILGMAQYPAFNLNDRSSYENENLKNRMLLDYFDPGSTMKGVSIASALDAGVVRLDNVFDCENGYWGRWKLKDSHPSKDLTVAEIVQQSSNIGTAKVALMMGKYRLWSYLRRFGFGQITNVGLGIEGGGKFPHPSTWYDIKLTRVPMGQGISVTAIQMLQAYCALANDGVMMQLYAVDRVEDPNSDSVTVFQPKIKRRVIGSKATQEIVKALSLVTKAGGTARRAAIDGIDVAGKTGTSQKWDDAIRNYSHSKYVASFIGFLPAEDPEFVLMVVADEPKKSHYGGIVAAPFFKKIAVDTLKYIQVDPLEK